MRFCQTFIKPWPVLEVINCWNIRSIKHCGWNYPGTLLLRPFMYDGWMDGWITGKGCFWNHLFRIRKEPTSECHHCDGPMNTLGEWTKQRRGLVAAIEIRILSVPCSETNAERKCVECHRFLLQTSYAYKEDGGA